MKTPILGSAYVARSVNAADNRMINLFPEMVPEGGKEPAFLSRRPGLGLWDYADGSGAPFNAPIRGMVSTYDLSAVGTPPVLYVVCGANLYTTRDKITFTDLGAIAGTGLVSMASSGTEVFIATNLGTSYIVTISTDTRAQITDGDFPGARCVTYIDGFFVFCTMTDQKVWCTDLLNGASISPLNFASAENTPDPVVAVFANDSELWVFGTKSAEVWYNAGLANFPFAPIQGVSLDVGCLCNFTIAKLDGTLFWFGQDQSGNCSIYRADGYRADKVSTQSIDWQIQNVFIPLVPNYNNPLNIPYAFSYQQGGHGFYCLGLDSGAGAGTQWVYDVTTQAWHQRDFISNTIRCQATFVVGSPSSNADGTVLFGSSKNNLIYYYDPTLYSDFVSSGTYENIYWLRSWRALAPGVNNLKRTAHHSLQLDCETGTHSLVVPVADPQVSLRWSDDGGHTWTVPRAISMGTSADYSHRVIWRRLGMTMKLRDRVYEVSGSDPVRITIMGAELILSPTNA